MESQEYKEMFYAEAKEHIDTLNNKLVNLEKDPQNHELINQLFRTFHTLKGNSATMGYEKFSKVAHKLEDILDLIRNEKLCISKDIMDALFLGCDTLEEGLEKINKDTPNDFDETKVLGAIETIHPTTIQHITGHKFSDKIEYTKEEFNQIKEKNWDMNKIKRVIIEFEENPLKSAKALMILKKIKDTNNPIIRITPREEEIKSSQFANILEIVLLIEKNEEVENAIKSVTKIKEYKILSPNESYISHAKEITKTKLVCEQKEEIKKVQDVRIDIRRLDNLMNMVGELLIYKMNLENINKSLSSKELENVTNAISLLAQSIQNEVLEERMIPLSNVFSRLPRIVRDLAKEEQKEVDFEVEGEENTLDRTVIDKITDPLIHMVRNSVDHGIETPDIREQKNKDRKAKIKLSATREKNKIIISLEDNGQGIDTQKVKEVAIKKGAYTEDQLSKMSEEKIQQLIFTPGFSTNEVVTEVSGRGVGMNVVETNVRQAGGRVVLSSKKGEGTKVRIELPLTMAIISVLLVEVSKERYAIPMTNVIETLKITADQIKRVENEETFILREEDIPLIKLDKALGKPSEKTIDSRRVIIVESQNKKIGVIVDSIETHQEILIKDLDEKVKKIKGIAGGTILGDGKVCFILDIDGLINT